MEKKNNATEKKTKQPQTFKVEQVSYPKTIDFGCLNISMWVLTPPNHFKQQILSLSK